MPKRKNYGHGTCAFQENWYHDSELSQWLQKGPNIYTAKCRFCPSALISLSSMGRQALTSHMKGQKHMKAVTMMASPSINSYMKSAQLQPYPTTSAISTIQPLPATAPAPSTISAIGTSPRPSTSAITSPPLTSTAPELTTPTNVQPLGQRGMKKYILNESVTTAEIITCIESVMTHSSFRACASGVRAMKRMFTDSEIAANMNINRTKVGYTIIYGLAPYFKRELVHDLLECSCFVVSFDESLNKICNKQQMDIIIKYWHNIKNEVTTRYYTSSFLQSSTAVDLQRALISSLEPLDVTNILQVSLDGPNVNMKMLKDLKVFLGEQGTDRRLIDFGCCGLHTVHNAFKVGMTTTGWNLVKFLRALYNYFKDSPARRGEFTRLTNSKRFPKKFCAVRWLENGEVAQTAIDILPNVRKYIEVVSKNKGEKSPSFHVLEDGVKDPLLAAKLAFFKTLAKDAEPFLKEFQTNRPFSPFLFTVLSDITKDVMRRFVKPEMVKINVDLDTEENLLLYSKINVGFLTRSEMSNSKNAKEVEKAVFLRDAKKGLKSFVKKIVQRSPMQFPISKSLTSLNPKLSGKDEGQKNFDKLIHEFVHNHWISGTKGDLVSRQFRKLVCAEEFIAAAKEFKRNTDRVDNFWIKVIHEIGNDEFGHLLDFLKMALILSHGNSDVERGFSINKECLVENLKESSLIGLRTVYDAVSAEGGIDNISITKSMLHAVRNSNSCYKDALKQAKSLEEEELQARAEKRRKKEELEELKSMKSKIEEEAKRECKQLEQKIAAMSKMI